ncbi:MAG: ABC transporter ATP-binding protein [Clostridiales bacterium]|nr:ABC transporter ATP-binding protein [Clostridiales bacterium]
MVKKAWRYIRVSIALSPFCFIFNITAIIIFRLAQLGTDLGLKYAAEVILESRLTGTRSINIILSFVLFFTMMTIGGNTGNFMNLMFTLYTNKAKKLFSKFFMLRAYEEKQDSFYNNEFYDNYEFIKKNIDNTTQVNSVIFNRLLSSLIRLIISVLAITYFSPYILLLSLIISVIVIIVNNVIVKKRIELDQKYINDERRAIYYSSLLSEKNHARELRIFRLKDKFLAKWHESFKNYADSKYKFEKQALLLSNIPSIVENITTAILIIYFLYLLTDEVLDVGDFVFLYRMMWSLTWSITGIVDIISSDIAQSLTYIDKYDKFVAGFELRKARNIRSERVQPENLFNKKYGDFNNITFEDVSYSYPSQKGNAVEKINLKIRKGEIVSILGYNGSGKSTLSKLMCGLLQDYRGTIKLNGTDISGMKREDLYRYFGIGFQDYAKYSISLKDNVAVGMIEKLEAEEEISEAIKKGNLEDIINNLPKGADTILGKEYDPDGTDLSGGQWQRVILSRAYMGEPEVLILDEPTASIDPIEEMRLLEHFDEIIKGKTAILISHRIGFARLSDRICVMDSGHIAEEGSHEELMALKGRYYEIFMSQQQLYAKEEPAYGNEKREIYA